MEDNEGLNWDIAAGELTDMGLVCTADQLQDPEWCYRELGKMGYSLRITYETDEHYLAKVRAIGKMSLDHPVVQQTVAQIKEAGGGYFTYQLEGREYQTRGTHNTFMLESLPQCAAIALTNMVRLNKEKLGNSTIN
jgi:hypothetical protein